MPGEDNRQLAVAIFDDFQQAFEVCERVPCEVVRFVDKEDNWALPFFYSCTQVPLAFLALGRDAYRLLGGPVVEECGDESPQRDSRLVDRQRLRGCFENLGD
jgi:hypothetical protein